MPFIYFVWIVNPHIRGTLTDVTNDEKPCNWANLAKWSNSLLPNDFHLTEIILFCKFISFSFSYSFTVFVDRIPIQPGSQAPVFKFENHKQTRN